MIFLNIDWMKHSKLKFKTFEDGYILDIEWLEEHLNEQGISWDDVPDVLKTPIVLTEAQAFDAITSDRHAQLNAYKKQLKHLYVKYAYRYRHRDAHTSNQDTVSVRSRLRTVLNRRNPFSDVAISARQFFHPGKHHYDVIGFRTGHTVSYTENDGESVYTLRPSFSVYKSQKPQTITPIVFDDSISRPMVIEGESIYL